MMALLLRAPIPLARRVGEGSQGLLVRTLVGRVLICVAIAATGDTNDGILTQEPSMEPVEEVSARSQMLSLMAHKSTSIEQDNSKGARAGRDHVE